MYHAPVKEKPAAVNRAGEESREASRMASGRQRNLSRLMVNETLARPGTVAAR